MKPSPSPDVMPKVEDVKTITAKDYGNEGVVLDEKRFIRCKLQDTQFIYKGTAGAEFNGCTVTNTRFLLAGYAERTSVFFTDLYKEPAFRLGIEGVFQQIRTGNFSTRPMPKTSE